MPNRIEVLLGKTRTPVVCFDRNRYFIDSLAKYADSSFVVSPFSAHIFSLLRSINVRGSHNLWTRWSNLICGKRLPTTSNYIGQYHFVFNEQTIKVAIDSADGRNLYDDTILRWSDIYFKCNYWPDVDYPDHVLPLVNGNGILSADKIEQLKTYRHYQKKFDLVYWSRIWASPNDKLGNMGVEHNIRLFECLAKVEGNISLLAVFPDNLNTPELQSYKDRLDAVGVKWQNGWGEIDSKVLWDSLAHSRINFLRPGNHLCISWRMMDLLCMGACIMLDGAPYAQWPVPLKEGENFVDVKCKLSRDYQLPNESTYKLINERVSNLIADDAKIQEISKNNIDYFDHHASMESVSKYIVGSILERFPELQNGLDPFNQSY